MQWLVNMSLDASASAPQTLRACLRQTLPVDDSNEATLLIASELVTNAVLHGESPIHARAGPITGGTRVEVFDSRAEMGAPTEESRGLFLTDHFAAAWGVDPADGGKVVWAEIPITPT